MWRWRATTNTTCHSPIHFHTDCFPTDIQHPCPRHRLPVSVVPRAAPIRRATRNRCCWAKITGAQVYTRSARAVESNELLGRRVEHQGKRKKCNAHGWAHCTHVAPNQQLTTNAAHKSCARRGNMKTDAKLLQHSLPQPMLRTHAAPTTFTHVPPYHSGASMPGRPPPRHTTRRRKRTCKIQALRASMTDDLAPSSKPPTPTMSIPFCASTAAANRPATFRVFPPDAARASERARRFRLTSACVKWPVALAPGPARVQACLAIIDRRALARSTALDRRRRVQKHPPQGWARTTQCSEALNPILQPWPPRMLSQPQMKEVLLSVRETNMSHSLRLPRRTICRRRRCSKRWLRNPQLQCPMLRKLHLKT